MIWDKGEGNTVIDNVDVDAQPLAPVPVKEYIPPAAKAIGLIVAFCNGDENPNGPNQEYTVDPLPNKLSSPPEQTGALEVSVSIGAGVTITLIVLVVPQGPVLPISV